MSEFCTSIPSDVILTVAHGNVTCPICGKRYADHPGVTIEVSSSVPPNFAYLFPKDGKRG